MNNDKIYYFPIKVLLYFLIFTEVLLFLGPRDYNVQSPVLLIIFFIFINLTLYKGYKKGVLIEIQRKNSFSRKTITKGTLNNIVIFGLLAFLIRFVSGLGTANLSISNLINTLLYSISNPGEAYSAKLESSKTTGLTYIIMILDPICFMAKTLGIYHWKRLSKLGRFFLLFQIFLEMVYWLGMGTRKGLGDMLIILFFILVSGNPSILLKEKNKRKFTITTVSLVAIFLFYFIFSNISRGGLAMSEILDAKIGAIKPFYKKNVSPYIYVPFCQINGYLCQGYYALSCALDAFVDGIVCWSYGFGSNWFKINMMEHLAPGLNVLSLTYQAYLEKTYDISPIVNWHSIYVWLANDFTFIGTFFVVHWIGKWFGRVWISACERMNDYAVPMVGLFALIVFYFFANNQVLSFSFITFWSLFFLYFLKNNRIL